MYHVIPRYTASQTRLYADEATALAIAEKEKRAYIHAMSGRSGEGVRRMAQDLGLSGIVLRVQDNADILEAT